jgi:hypothetical protein
MSSRKILAAELAILLGVVGVAMGQAQRDAASSVPSPATPSPTKVQEPGAAATAETTSSPQTSEHAATPATSSSGDPRVHASDEAALRLEGEKRFEANCGRCHVAPPKFPPREMATVLRHMRVRAMITDEDQKLILHYMTE